jgi:acyl-coenzyme A synthetase/AMP-(fatty) acid ligase
VPGALYDFQQVEPETDTDLCNEPKLLELVVLAESEDCPALSLRHTDGHFYTGDLFEEVIPGHYTSRGRKDDWIKCGGAGKCDTKWVS